MATGVKVGGNGRTATDHDLTAAGTPPGDARRTMKSSKTEKGHVPWPLPAQTHTHTHTQGAAPSTKGKGREMRLQRHSHTCSQHGDTHFCSSSEAWGAGSACCHAGQVRLSGAHLCQRRKHTGSVALQEAPNATPPHQRRSVHRLHCRCRGDRELGRIAGQGGVQQPHACHKQHRTGNAQTCHSCVRSSSSSSSGVHTHRSQDAGAR